MSAEFVPFDEIWGRVRAVLAEVPLPEHLRPVYLTRNMYGVVSVLAPPELENDESRDVLGALADRLARVLGPHGGPQRDDLLVLSGILPDWAGPADREFAGFPGIYAVDQPLDG